MLICTIRSKIIHSSPRIWLLYFSASKYTVSKALQRESHADLNEEELEVTI
jgi:hypothetical protein